LAGPALDKVAGIEGKPRVGLCAEVQIAVASRGAREGASYTLPFHHRLVTPFSIHSLGLDSIFGWIYVALLQQPGENAKFPREMRQKDLDLDTVSVAQDGIWEEIVLGLSASSTTRWVGGVR
jgi:hypothetical protein